MLIDIACHAPRRRPLQCDGCRRPIQPDSWHASVLWRSPAGATLVVVLCPACGGRTGLAEVVLAGVDTDGGSPVRIR